MSCADWKETRIIFYKEEERNRFIFCAKYFDGICKSGGLITERVSINIIQRPLSFWAEFCIVGIKPVLKINLLIPIYKITRFIDRPFCTLSYFAGTDP